MRTATDQVGVQTNTVSSVLDLRIYARIAGWLWSAAKAHLKWLEQGDRARIMRLAYIRDVGIGTEYEYTVPIFAYILDTDYPDYIVLFGFSI
jgi:hypothetical protein